MWNTQRSVLSHQANTKTQTSAVKRLLKDVRALADCKPPPVGIAALPLEKDLFEWHANLKGPKGTPFEGAVFHLIMKFPHSYPYNPPTVSVCTKLPHPNVVGNELCLDMLQPGSEDLYSGWSTAYSVLSILIQLQSFLFEIPTVEIDKETSQEYRSAKEKANNYACSGCAHKPFRVWPEFPNIERETFVVVKSDLDIAKEELVCFHSKRDFTDDTLGYGISFNRSIRTGEIQNITTGLDLIGIKAFMREGVRKSANNEPFTHWIPIYINEEHGTRAIPLAKRALSMICKGNTKSFDPSMVIEVIPKLMNTMIVQIMKGKIHASIKMLEGYCAFHMLFLLFLNEYPELLKQVHGIVNTFLTSEEGRHKDKTPNLGEFLTLLSVVPIEWKTVCPLLVAEGFDRQVFQLVKTFPQFNKKEADPAVDKERANVTFEATLVSQRLFMFHKYFLQGIVGPLGKNLQEKIDTYQATYGKPTSKMIDSMLNAFKDITKVNNYSEYFSHIGYPQQTQEQITAWLRQSVENSERKGYHNLKGPKVPTHEELAAERAAKLVPLKSLCDETGQLKSDEAQWRRMCEDIYDYKTLPEGEKDISNPWRHLYLMNIIQDTITRLNNRPDFTEFYETLDLSAPILTKLDVALFLPNKLKSGFYYLTGVISRLTQLQSLVVTKTDTQLDTKGSKALLNGIKKGKTLPLSILDLSHVNPTAELIAGLSELSLLHTLNLSANKLPHESVIALSKVLWEHKCITNLDLTNCGINAEGGKLLADALLANKKLKVISLGKNPLGRRGLTAILYNLAFSPSIATLNLPKLDIAGGRGGGQEDIDLAEALTKLFQITQTLTSLNLWQTSISGSLNQLPMAALGANRSIVSLDLGEVGQLNASHMGYFGLMLANNKTLQNLNLENNTITGDALQSLYNSLFKEKEEAKETAKPSGGVGSSAPHQKKTQNREDLRNAIMDKTQEKEKEFHFNLKCLNLQKNSLYSAGGKVIGKLVIISQYLTELHLESSNLGVEAGETLGLALETNTVLNTLYLKRNNLGKEGAQHLAFGLKNNKALTYLDISGNGLGVAGSQAFADMLRTNNKLAHLNLFGNLCDVDGAIAIAGALSVNSTLTKLDLGLNRIRDKGAQAIADALSTNTTLQKLALKLNFVKNGGALALANVIVKNKQTKLSSISLAGNNIDHATLLQISESIKLREPAVHFDLQSRVELMDPDRMERRVWVSPLPIRTTNDLIKKLFLDNNCGVVTDVDLHDHKNKEGSTKYRYAFVEFAHKNSVELALGLPPNKARVLSKRIGVYRAGSQTRTADKPEEERSAARERRGGSVRERREGYGGRGRPSGGRGGARGGYRGGARGDRPPRDDRLARGERPQRK